MVMMMMMMPHLQQSGENTQSPMSGLMMATLMRQMSSSNSDSYDYDYDYDYDSYGYDDESDDYDYEDDESSSPLSMMIRQMLQQKLAGKQPAVQVSLIPDALEEPAPEDEMPEQVEIAPGNIPSDEISYRSAP